MPQSQHIISMSLTLKVDLRLIPLGLATFKTTPKATNMKTVTSQTAEDSLNGIVTFHFEEETGKL